MKKGWREETRQRESGQSREGGDKGDPGREKTIEGRARERRERKK